MAQTLALTILAQEYASQLVPTVNRTCVALSTLPIRMGGGSNCAWVVKGDGATAAVMADGAAAGTAANDPQHAATLNWAYYKADGGATGPAQAASATADSPDMDVLAENINDSIAKMCSVVNGHTFTGDPTASPVEVGGLDYVLTSTTNTYAGINRTTGSNAFFRPNVFNPGVATPVSQGMLRKDLADIKVACGESPDLAFCHPDVFNEIANTFDANRRYVQEVTTSRGLVKLDASVNAISLSGCTYIEDKDATRESGNTSGRIYYLNSRHVEYEVLPPKEIRGLLAEIGITQGAMLRGNDGFGEIPLMCAVVEIAKAGDADLFMAKTYLQLKVKSPKHCGVRRFVQINS